MGAVTAFDLRRAFPLLVIAIWLAASPLPAQDPSAQHDRDPGSKGIENDFSADRAARGRTSYRVYCQACHGERGKGDGPVAQALKVPPTDLTQISARNGDRFPVEEVYKSIDGRTEIRAHGPSEMPVWGFSFQDPGRSDNQEPEIRERILDLVAYLKSIQQRDEGAP